MYKEYEVKKDDKHEKGDKDVKNKFHKSGYNLEQIQRQIHLQPGEERWEGVGVMETLPPC